MKCTKAQKMISDFIDGELDGGKTTALKKHLDSCPECQTLLENFQRIKHKAKGLEKAEPSRETWFQIQAAIKEKAQAVVPGPRIRFLFFPAPLRFAVSAALLILVVVGAMIIGLRIGNQSGIQNGTSGQEYALAKIQEAEQHYKLAIKALWEAVQSQKDNLDPKIAETFRINLELIDASLADCRRAVENDPRNMESRYYLLAVYKKKAELLDNMIEVSSTVPKSKESKTII
jgi:tetratricopeptide (TPR) repeat protein